MSGPVRACDSCRRERPHKALGWCTGCYMSWCRAGRPDTGPPAPSTWPRMGVTTCTACGNERPHKGRGWCHACYHRWYRAGQPESGPPAPSVRQRVAGDACTSCGGRSTRSARGWCTSCYSRWRRAGKPDTGPPPPRHASTADVDHRVSEFAFLLSCGETPERAAERVGIRARTAKRYKAHLATLEMAVA